MPVATYHSVDREQIKDGERSKIVSYLLKHHTPRLPMRYFGFPADHYRTEAILHREWDAGTRFIGMERNWKIFQRARNFMPGGCGFECIEEFNGLRLLSAVNRDKTCRLINYGCASFMNLGRKFKKGKLHRRQFANSYKRWTAFWLDTCATATGELLDSLMRVDQFCSRDAVVVPFALTFQIGRETHFSSMLEGRSGDALGIRVDLIRSVLGSREYRTCEIDDAWRYESAGGVGMGCVSGRMLLK